MGRSPTQIRRRRTMSKNKRKNKEKGEDVQDTSNETKSFGSNIDANQTESSRKQSADKLEITNGTVSNTDTKATTHVKEQEEGEVEREGRGPEEEEEEKEEEGKEEESTTEEVQDIVLKNTSTGNGKYVFDGKCVSDNLYRRIYPVVSETINSQEFRQRHLNKSHGNVSAIFISAGKDLEKENNFEKINNYLALLNYEFNFIGFSETSLKQHSLHMCGYKCLCHNREVEKGGGGVCLFVRDHIHYERKNYLKIEVHGCNFLFIEIPCPTGRNIVVGVVYIPPSIVKKKFEKFTKSFKDVLSKLNQKNKLCFIMGDFNINLFSNHFTRREFVEMVFNNGFYPLINRPTRVTRDSTTLIDNIFTNANYKTTGITGAILESDVSDHRPIFMSSSVEYLPRRNEQPPLFRRIQDQGIDKLNNRLQKTDWNPLYSIKDINEKCHEFGSQFNTSYNECFPLTEDTYITPEIVELFEKNNEVTKLEQLIKTSKQKYNNFKYYNMDIDGPYECYRLKQNKCKSSMICSCISNEANQHEMANLFNKYQLPGKAFNEKVICCPTPYMPTCTWMNFTEVTPDEIVNIAKDIFKDNAPLDSDDIHPRVVKKIIISISEPLSHIFNQSLQQGVCPDAMKITKHIVFFKKKKSEYESECKEKWTLSCIGEILERSIHDQTKQKLTENMIINSDQPFDTFEEIGELERSFRAIDKGILLNKLKEIGIGGNVHKWFSSYLDSRYQFTKYKSAFSDCKDVSGVIPCSLLGFLLYNIYTGKKT